MLPRRDPGGGRELRRRRADSPGNTRAGSAGAGPKVLTRFPCCSSKRAGDRGQLRGVSLRPAQRSTDEAEPRDRPRRLVRPRGVSTAVRRLQNAMRKRRGSSLRRRRRSARGAAPPARR
eukprot:scaffold8119_cov258-Pinguiococcus_pyrenoidosus.AAC.1